MSKSWARGSTPAWRRVRARVLQANQQDNGGRCTLQIKGVCTGQATQVHHVVGREVSGDDERFLVATCGPCNRRVGEPKRSSPQHKNISRW